MVSDDEMDTRGPRPIVVGVTPAQPEVVVREGARLAHRYRTTLICAYADVHSYTVDEQPDGRVKTAQIPPPTAAEPGFVGLVDPGPADQQTDQQGLARFDERFAEHLLAVVAESVQGSDVPVAFRQLAGDPAQALARLAGTLDAELIVVGSRSAGLRAGIREFLGRSVAVHLVHRQARPVVVVPVAPIRDSDPLPWDLGGSAPD